MVFRLHYKNLSLLLLLLSMLLLSCASYNKRMVTYYHQLENKQYNKAMNTLNKTSFIQRDRNKLLCFFEKGKLYHLMHEYDSSNIYLNKADGFIDTEKKSVADIIKSNTINPMMAAYLGEDVERFMMHYYKGLNYTLLNQPNEALVEARRISLANNALQDKFTNKQNRYSKDAFALNLQGMLYEAAGDMNNAFIAYRNAADVYLNNNSTYYNVALPKQLMQDVLRTANLMGFSAEQHRYEKLFNTNFLDDTSISGSLIVFFEKGFAPIKRERNYIVTKDENGLNGFYFFDEIGNRNNLNFDANQYNLNLNNNASLQSFRSFRVAMPYYEIRSYNNNAQEVVVNNKKYTTETAQDINYISTAVLKERLLKEITNALARQITKRLTELAAKKSAEAIAKGKEEKDSKDADKKKTEEKAKKTGEVAGLLVNIINNITEKADTRSWQSLPAFIQYVRIPLKKGENIISINGKSFTVLGKGGLQFYSNVAW